MTRNKMLFAVFIVLLSGAFTDLSEGAQAKDEVRIAAGQEVMVMDPLLFTSGNDKVITENWAECLLQRQPSGEVTPGLVTSWKMAPDGKKLEATLRKGVKFIHGDPLTTKDVKFSYERGITKNPSMQTNLAMVDRLEVIDDYRFTIYFKDPDVTFIPRLFGGIPVCSKSYYDRVGDDGFAKDPSGTGPYKLVNYKPGEYIDIERFEGYWGKKPPIKKARIYFIGEDSTRVAKLMAGEVDLIMGVPFTSVDDLRKNPNFKLVTLNTNHPTRSILMGSKNPKVPWYDKRVRLAMALAIDNKAIIHMLSDIPIYLPALAPSELGYDPEIKPYGYDPKKAKALLAEAGYPNGFEAEFNFPIGGRTSMTQETVEMIASYWAAVGIRVKLAGQETEAMLADRKKALDPKAVAFMFYTCGMSGGVDPSHAIRNYLTSQGSRPGYSNPESDKLMVKARSTMDNKERAELIKKAARIIHDDVGYIPIFTAVSVYATKNNIDYTPTKGVNFDYMYVKDVKFK